MKKLIAALTLALAFTINANAQDKKSTVNADKAKTQSTQQLSAGEKAKNEATELAQFLGLNETQKADFQRLFEQKHRTLEDATLSQERRNEVSRIVELKIRATLDGNQMDKLDKNPELLKRLVN